MGTVKTTPEDIVNEMFSVPDLLRLSDRAIQLSTTMLGRKRNVSQATLDSLAENSRTRKRKPCSEETKQKMRDSQLGRKLSPEHIKKATEAANAARKNKPYVVSEEHKKKLREVHTGKIVSAETRKKISEAVSGHKVSEETRKKMSESMKAKHAARKEAK